MATFSEHENATGPSSGRPVFLRLLRYARRYLPLILLTSLLVLGYSGARYARAYLAKPLIDRNPPLNPINPQSNLTHMAPPSRPKWSGSIA